MSSQAESSGQEPYYIFTDEEADRLIPQVLYTDLGEPEPLVRVLLILHDHIQEARLKDSVYLLMRVAFRYSIVHSVNFQEYLEAIERDQDPAEEARARRYGSQNSEA